MCDERKTESTYKKKNLYIFIYRQKEKEGAKGHKKRGYFVAPLIPGKRTLTTKALRAYL